MKAVTAGFFLILFVSACASVDTSSLKSGASSAFQAAKSGAQRGAGAVGNAGRSLASSVGNDGGEVADAGSVAMFTDIALDQVPHTLLRKPVAEGRLTSDFGRRRNPTSWIGFPKYHRGIDFGAPAGTPVYASGDGVVIQRRVSDSYGNVVKIEHANGFETLYAHLAAFAEGVDVGTKVSRGQQIGAVGSTGRSTAAHLHYELYHRGKRINPLYTKPTIGADS